MEEAASSGILYEFPEFGTDICAHIIKKHNKIIEYHIYICRLNQYTTRYDLFYQVFKTNENRRRRLI